MCEGQHGTPACCEVKGKISLSRSKGGYVKNIVNQQENRKRTRFHF